MVAETGPPIYRTGDRRLAYWTGGNTATLSYPRSATSADASVAQASHGSSQLGRSESTVGSVESTNDNRHWFRHWFRVEPTLRAVEGVVTPLDPARSPYLFFSITASSAGRRTIALSGTGSRSSPYDETLDVPDTSLATPVSYTTYAHLAVFGRAITVAA